MKFSVLELVVLFIITIVAAGLFAEIQIVALAVVFAIIVAVLLACALIKYIEGV